MKTIKILCLALLTVALAACQQNGYQIKGTAEGAADGDTLLLSTDFMEGNSADTIIIKNKKFELKGQADSVQLAVIFFKNRPELAATFLLESGTITIDMKQEPGQSKVGGTKANEAWQQLTEISADYGEQIQSTAEKLYEEGITEERQKAVMDQINQLQDELGKKVVELTEQNLDNELGYFLVTNFSDDTHFTPELRKQFIEKMPKEYQQRNAVKEILKELENIGKTEKGQHIDDVSLKTPEGEELSVMSEVSKNRITILDFWASWCGPCRAEMPAMIELYKKYHEQGLGIIGISLDEKHDDWVKAIGEFGLTWPQISDLKGWNSQAAEQFNVKSIPFMIVLDQQGVILEKGLRGEQLSAFVGEHLL